MKQYIVCYGAIRLHGVFSVNRDEPLYHGTRVIVRTSRGLESGTILCEANSQNIATLPEKYEENRLVRVMTKDDLTQRPKIDAAEKGEFIRTRAIVERMNIPLELVYVEHIFGGERLIVYYTAEGRIDFRELVKVLASEFQTRVEMRQIRARDVSKILVDVGECGRNACCTCFQGEMASVGMKIAKLQTPAINPSKISGRCGRLKCCYRFEHDHYAELRDLFPPVGKIVQTPDGPGRVMSQALLAKRVQVDLGQLGYKYFTVDEVELLPDPPSTPDPEVPATGSRHGRPGKDRTRSPKREGGHKVPARYPKKKENEH